MATVVSHSTRRMIRWRHLLLRTCWMPCLLLAGCFGTSPQPDYSSLNLVDVTGIVRVDGRPTDGVRVIFENENEIDSYSDAITDSNGRYRLMYNSQQPGISAGRKKVRISTVSVVDEDVRGQELIHENYNTKSDLFVEVTAEQRQFDFDVKQKPR